MNCKFCKSEITEAQYKEYEGCCDGVCEYRNGRIVENDFCKNCGIPIDLEKLNLYEGFCSGGCAGEYSER